MKTVSVGDIAQQVRGVTFSKAEAATTPREGYVSVLTAGNIQDGRILSSALTYVPTNKVSTIQRIRRHDVVICTSSGSLGVVGKAAQSDGTFTGAFGAFLKVLRPGPTVDPRYFAQFFLTPAYRKLVSSLATGANIKNLKSDHLNTLQLPVVPLSEQRRIAAILDQADAIRTKRRDALARIDSLGEAIFHQMFGALEASTETTPFGSLSSLSGGKSLVADDANAKSDFRVLKISAVTSGQFKAEESKPLPLGYTPPLSHLVRPGDLLMSRANTTELVGAVAYVVDAPPNLALPDKVWRFDWKVAAEPVFYRALLRTPSMRRKLSRLASGTGGSMKNISKTKLESMPVPLIPLSQQRSFVERATKVAQQAQHVQSALAADDELFASLQSRAFRGEL